MNAFPKYKTIYNRTEIERLFSNICDAYHCSLSWDIIYSYDFVDKLSHVHQRLSCGESVFVITTYNTVGVGKNIQYPVPYDQFDRVVWDKKCNRNDKDFEGVYLSSPTNLIQSIRYSDENKFENLAKHIFQLEYLAKAKIITHPVAIHNIESAFRVSFFGSKNTAKTMKGTRDYANHCAQTVIQAIGRICRCRNKNKNIYIYLDQKIASCFDNIREDVSQMMLNREVLSITEIAGKKVNPELVDKCNSADYYTVKEIRTLFRQLRTDRSCVDEWKELRKYVLANPTSYKIDNRYVNKYFYFPTTFGAQYSYRRSNSRITEIYAGRKEGLQEVSQYESALSAAMKFDFIRSEFQNRNFATEFLQAPFHMSPALYRQIYKGALGEEIGKILVERYLHVKLCDIDNVSLYEKFDYKIGDVYFDFKNWHYFQKNLNSAISGIQRKLKEVRGKVCIVMNLLKRNGAPAHRNLSDTVVQIPWLLDPETHTVNEDGILQLGRYLY